MNRSVGPLDLSVHCLGEPVVLEVTTGGEVR